MMDIAHMHTLTLVTLLLTSCLPHLPSSQDRAELYNAFSSGYLLFLTHDTLVRHGSQNTSARFNLWMSSVSKLLS